MSVCAGCGAELPPKTYRGRDRKWCKEACRTEVKRQWARDHTPGCVDCGVPLGESARQKGNVRCQPCHSALRRWAHEVRLDIVQGCYEAGWSLKDISGAVGANQYTVAVNMELRELRRLGRIGYRYRMDENGRRLPDDANVRAAR